jgi:hypothetical protein
LLRIAGEDGIEHVDWDRIRFRLPARRSWFSTSRTVHMPVPFGSTRAINQQHFVEAAPLGAVLDALQASDDGPSGALVPVAPEWTIRKGEDR